MKIADFLGIINPFKKGTNAKKAIYKQPDYKLKMFSDNTGAILINYYYNKNIFTTAFEKSIKKLLGVPKYINFKDAIAESEYEIERDPKNNAREFFFERLEPALKKTIEDIRSQINEHNIKIPYYKIKGLIFQDKQDHIKVTIAVEFLWL